MKNRKVGEIFGYGCVDLKVVEDQSNAFISNCEREKCYFYPEKCYNRNRNITGHCQAAMREDGKAVHFELTETWKDDKC